MSGKISEDVKTGLKGIRGAGDAVRGETMAAVDRAFNNQRHKDSAQKHEAIAEKGKRDMQALDDRLSGRKKAGEGQTPAGDVSGTGNIPGVGNVSGVGNYPDTAETPGVGNTAGTRDVSGTGNVPGVGNVYGTGNTSGAPTTTDTENTPRAADTSGAGNTSGAGKGPYRHPHPLP